jgi:hypothetical protein
MFQLAKLRNPEPTMPQWKVTLATTKKTPMIIKTRRLLRRSHWPENNEIRAMVQKAGIQILNRKQILWTF